MFNLKLITTVLPAACWVGLVYGQPTLGTPVQSDAFRDQIAVEPSWWSQLGGSSLHNGDHGTNQTSGAILGDPDWISDGDGQLELDFTPHAGVVCDDERVYAVGYDQQFSHTIAAFNLSDGQMAWSQEIPFALLDSWSTPTIDSGNDTILVATGFSLLALDRYTGDEIWRFNFTSPLVNASPCVTDNLGPADRVFITDYSFSSGATGLLVCINVDPFDAVLNPYQPGDLVWSVNLPGECAGNTPAYDQGVVYVSTADNGSGGGGHVLAFDATSVNQPTPIWNTPNPQPFGFFSAVSIANGSVYASSYNFNGGQRSANTIKLRASDGALQWSVPTVRTDAAPVVLEDGRVLVSGGVPTSPASFFTGSLPAIELIQDLGNSAVVLWDSFESTHEDLNSNGFWDQGEPYLSLGGWGHHPLVFRNHGPAKLLVATMSPPTSGAPLTHGNALHTIDLSKYPNDPNFIISTQLGIGTTPALFGNRVLTTSSDGVTSLMLNPEPIVQPITERLRGVVDGDTPLRAMRISK